MLSELLKALTTISVYCLAQENCQTCMLTEMCGKPFNDLLY